MAEVEEAETCDCGKDRHFRFVKWCEKHCIQTAGGRCKFVVCLLVSVLCSGGIYQKSENKTKQSSKTNFPSNIHPGVKQITGWFGSVCLLFVFCCVLWIYLPNAPGECVFVKMRNMFGEFFSKKLTNQQTPSKAWISWTSFNNRAQVVSPVVWPMDRPCDWKWEQQKHRFRKKIGKMKMLEPHLSKKGHAGVLDWDGTWASDYLTFLVPFPFLHVTGAEWAEPASFQCQHSPRYHKLFQPH